MIESGRYGHIKIPKENRICKICSSNEIENERHLIFSCNYYNDHRNRLFNYLKQITKIEFNPKDHEIQFITMIMKSTNPEIVRSFSKFIYDCFKLRENYLQS